MTIVAIVKYNTNLSLVFILFHDIIIDKTSKRPNV